MKYFLYYGGFAFSVLFLLASLVGAAVFNLPKMLLQVKKGDSKWRSKLVKSKDFSLDTMEHFAVFGEEDDLDAIITSELGDIDIYDIPDGYDDLAFERRNIFWLDTYGMKHDDSEETILPTKVLVSKAGGYYEAGFASGFPFESAE